MRDTGHPLSSSKSVQGGCRTDGSWWQAAAINIGNANPVDFPPTLGKGVHFTVVFTAMYSRFSYYRDP